MRLLVILEVVVGPPHDQRVGAVGNGGVLVRVVHGIQHVAHGFEPGPFLVIGLHHRPRCVPGIGVEEHGFLGLGVGVPFVQAGKVGGGEFPLLHRVRFAGGKAGHLFGPAHGEPQFVQQGAGVDQHPLQLRDLPHEFQVLRRRAVTHHPFDAGPVVPGAVHHHYFPAAGQGTDVALEVPLGHFFGGGFFQCDHPGAAGVEMLIEPFDRSALPGGIAAFEDEQHFLAGLLDPELHFQQFYLQLPLLPVIGAPVQLGVIGIVVPPGVVIDLDLELFRLAVQLLQFIEFLGVVLGHGHPLTGGCAIAVCIRCGGLPSLVFGVLCAVPGGCHDISCPAESRWLTKLRCRGGAGKGPRVTGWRAAVGRTGKTRPPHRAAAGYRPNCRSKRFMKAAMASRLTAVSGR